MMATDPLRRPHFAPLAKSDLVRSFHLAAESGDVLSQQAISLELTRRKLGIMGQDGLNMPADASGLDGMGQGQQGMAQGPHGAAQGAAMGSATGMQRAQAPGGAMAPGGGGGEIGLVLKALAALLASVAHPQQGAPPQAGPQAAPPQAMPPQMGPTMGGPPQ